MLQSKIYSSLTFTAPDIDRVYCGHGPEDIEENSKLTQRPIPIQSSSYYIQGGIQILYGEAFKFDEATSLTYLALPDFKWSTSIKEL